MKEIYERLQYARSNAGFKEASEAARYFGWNENTYRSHENGQRGFRHPQADIYAKAFKVPVEWLYYGRGSKNASTADDLTKKINQLEPAVRILVESHIDLLLKQNGDKLLKR